MFFIGGGDSFSTLFDIFLSPLITLQTSIYNFYLLL